MKSRDFVLRVLSALQLFVALGAIPAALIMILRPDGAGIFPLSMLAPTPFSNFLVPGLVLFSVNGLASLWAGVLSRRRSVLSARLAMLLGVFLILWIMSQVYWFRAVHWLHLLYFTLGLVELGLGLWLQRARPAALA